MLNKKNQKISQQRKEELLSEEKATNDTLKQKNNQLREENMNLLSQLNRMRGFSAGRQEEPKSNK